MSINNIERLARVQSNPFRGGVAEPFIFSGAKERSPLAEKEPPSFQGRVHQIASSQLNPAIEEQNQLQKKIVMIAISILGFGLCWKIANDFNSTFKDMCYTKILEFINENDIPVYKSRYFPYFLFSSISCPYLRLYNKIGSLGVAAGLFGLGFALFRFLSSTTDYFKNVPINEQKDYWAFRNKTKIISASAVSFALLSILFDKESHTLTEGISHFAIFGCLGGLIGAGFCHKIRKTQQAIQSEKAELTKMVDQREQQK